jgi:hypothetical protein
MRLVLEPDQGSRSGCGGEVVDWLLGDYGQRLDASPGIVLRTLGGSVWEIEQHVGIFLSQEMEGMGL